MTIRLRYRPGTDLARRFPLPSSPLASREYAESIRRACINAEHIEVVESDTTEESA